jgi:hypothetical protein
MKHASRFCEILRELLLRVSIISGTDRPMTQKYFTYLYSDIQRYQATWIYLDEPTTDPPGRSRPRRAKKMTPNLAPSTLEFIRDMILSNVLTRSQIAKAAGRHPSTITRHVTNMN